MFIVYVLRSKTNGKIYIGSTKDLYMRLKRHNQELPSKRGSYTRLNRGPWVVIYKEVFKTRNEALSREKQLKSAKGREFIRKEVLKQ